MAPAGPRLVDRGDLVAALDHAAEKKVTVISAPAGSGKTSLLRAWADRAGQPHRLAVVQVQRDQRDAQQFWLPLLGAVRQAVSATASRAEPPTATPDFNGRAMVDRVLAELAGQAQLMQMQREIAAGGQHRMNVARKVRQQPGELGERVRAGQLVEVVDDQDEAAVMISELR